MSPIPIGKRHHVVVVQNPGAAASDGDGGYTQTFSDATPRTWHVAIEPATARTLERIAAATVIAQASHIVTGMHHAEVTTKTRLVFGARTFNVLGVANPEERNIETVAVCAEVVT